LEASSFLRLLSEFSKAEKLKELEIEIFEGIVSDDASDNFRIEALEFKALETFSLSMNFIKRRALKCEQVF